MALQVSASHLHSALAQAERLKHKYHGAIQKAHHVVGTAVRTAEVGAGAFAMGVLQGRLPKDKEKVLGVDIALGAAVLTHTLGYAGIGGEYAGHLHGFGDGFLASFLTTQGIKMGLDWQQKKLGTKVQGALGNDGTINGESLRDDDLAAVARNGK